MMFGLYAVLTAKKMLHYHFNGEQKHTMIIVHLIYHDYVLNILYEDTEGSDIHYHISNNINDFFDTKETITKIKNVFINMLQKDFEKECMYDIYYVPEYIQKMFIRDIQGL